MSAMNPKAIGQLKAKVRDYADLNTATFILIPSPGDGNENSVITILNLQKYKII